MVACNNLGTDITDSRLPGLMVLAGLPHRQRQGRDPWW